MKLLDSTVAIDHLRGHPGAKEVIGDAIRTEGSIFASEIVRFEVLAGARESERAAVEDFFAVVSWIPVLERISRTAAELVREYRLRFSGIDDADYLIAATAIVSESDLLTTNVRHFPMIEGLRRPY